MRGLSLVAASGGHSSSRCAGLSLSRPLLLRSTGSRRAGSVAVAHGPSCSAACGILPDQGSNPCPLHRQADSQPLRHQESPRDVIYKLQMKSLGKRTWNGCAKRGLNVWTDSKVRGEEDQEEEKHFWINFKGTKISPPPPNNSGLGDK